MRKVCIYAVNAREDGSLFAYQRFFMKKILELTDMLYLVSDVDLKADPESEEILSTKVKRYVCCGYDVEKWKYVLFNCCMELGMMDEVIICNDSFIGPVYDLNKMFQKMENIPFWGITEHRGFLKNREYINSFLQRYFMVFPTTLLQNEEFYLFWQTLENVESYGDTEDKFEFRFSKFMESLGYQYATYIDLSDMMPRDGHYALSHFIHESAMLIRDKGLPFAAIASFTVKKSLMLVYGDGNNAADTYELLRQKTEYPMDCLDEVLLEKNNIYDLWNTLNLHRVIVPSKEDRRLRRELKGAVIIAYLFYEDLFPMCLHMLNMFASKVKVVIITDSKEKERLAKQYAHKRIDIRRYEGKGRDWGALLIGCKDIFVSYENVCFVHDKKSDYLAYRSLGRDFGRLLWQNILGTYGHLLGIIKYLADNPNIGMLVPPTANHGVYFENFVNYWTVCYADSVALLRSMGVNTDMLDSEKPPISIGSAFWIRARVLTQISEWISEDSFPAHYGMDGSINHVLERIAPYVCQKDGLYTVSVSNMKYAGMLYCNDRYMLREICAGINVEKGYCTFQKLKEEVSK